MKWWLTNPASEDATDLLRVLSHFPMQLRELTDTLAFLQRVYVGKGDEERFIRLIAIIEREIAEKKTVVRPSHV